MTYNMFLVKPLNDGAFTIEQDEDGPMERQSEFVALKPGVSLSLDSWTLKQNWSDLKPGKFEEILFEVGELG